MEKTCQRCNKKIPKARLKAIPDTDLCVRCSELIGGDFEVIVIEENVGSSVVSKPMVYKRKREIETTNETSAK